MNEIEVNVFVKNDRQVNDFVKNDRQLFRIFGKKFNKSVSRRKKFLNIKQLIELNSALNQIKK